MAVAQTNRADFGECRIFISTGPPGTCVVAFSIDLPSPTKGGMTNQGFLGCEASDLGNGESVQNLLAFQSV